jgi:membrane protease YdiL (CAAX protease family)
VVLSEAKRTPADLARAMRQSGAVRDAFAAEHPIPSLSTYRRQRTALAVSALPALAMLLELDREIVRTLTGGRLVIDLLLIAWPVFELSRKTPRMPRVAATCMAAIALRWAIVVTKLCGHRVHPLTWVALVLSIVAATMWLLVPSRERVTIELFSKLGVARPDAPTPPSSATVVAAIACAAGPPLFLHLGLGPTISAVAIVAFAAAAPFLLRHFGHVTPPRAQVLLGIATGLALTTAAVSVGRQFFDVGAELARCVGRLDQETRLARSAESLELVRAVERVRASGLLVFMTALVFPFAEERIYRGILQDVLVRKYGERFGIFAAAMAFGVAHLGVYEVALYQTVLLGIGFGVAYAEGGLIASFVVHAVWNVLQIG